MISISMVFTGKNSIEHGVVVIISPTFREVLFSNNVFHISVFAHSTANKVFNC